MLCSTYRHGASSAASVFHIAAPGVVAYSFDDTCSDGILVDVSQQCDEIGHVIDGLALETVLEQMTFMFITAIEMDGISDADAPDDGCETFLSFPDQKVHMVGHQAVGVDGASRW